MADLAPTHREALGLILLDQQGALVALFDRDFQTLFCTPELARLAGADEGEPASLYKAMPGYWQDACLLALSGETIHTPRTEIGGEQKRILKSTIRPHYGADGSILGVAVICDDCTTAAHSEREVAIAQDTLRVAMSAAQCGIWRLDLQAKQVWVSPEYERIIGARLSFDDLSSPTPGWLYADDLPKYRAFLAELSGPAGRASIEHRLAADPSVWVHAACERVRDAAGKSKVFVGLARNITARKQAELNLAAATSRATQALEEKRSMLEDILRDLGLKSDRPLQSDAIEITDHAAGVAELTNQFLALSREMEARDAMLSAAIHSLRVSRGEAQQASLAKSQFLATMTHELRTPLNAIIGYSELLLEDATAAANSDAAQDLRRVLAAAGALLELIDAIFDLTRLEAGDLKPIAEPFAAEEIARQAAESFRGAAFRNANTLTLAPQTLGAVVGDSARTRQCLSILLSNACKFTRDGKIHLSMRRETHGDGDRIVYEVADTGIGIAPEQIDRLFRPFVQADASKTRSHDGAGVGLAIARGLAKLLGGDVSVRSETGRGSVFTLTIAANIENRAPAKADAA